MSRAELQDQRLIIALRAATVAAQGPRELWSLRWQAMETSRSGRVGLSGTQQRGEENAIGQLEVAVSLVKQLAGITHNITISEAKLHLRKYGEEGDKLASVLSAMSKPRNRRAHPQAAGFLAAVRFLVKMAGASRAISARWMV